MYTIRILEEGSGQVGVGNYVWVALAVFFLMVFLGWLVVNKGWLKKEDEAAVVAHDSHESEHKRVESAPSAHPKVKDDLTTLEGIGPKVAKVLAGIGITTFEGLANADNKKIKTALDAAGYKYMDPAGWIDQAILAAKGDTVGLKKLQASLKGGRKTV